MSPHNRTQKFTDVEPDTQSISWAPYVSNEKKYQVLSSEIHFGSTKVLNTR